MRQRVTRHLCLGCRSQRARFRYRGRVRADRDHSLCFRCYRSACDQLRARRMAGATGNPLILLTLRPRGDNNAPFPKVPRALPSSTPASASAYCRQ
jgi:hypothetical protein